MKFSKTTLITLLIFLLITGTAAAAISYELLNNKNGKIKYSTNGKPVNILLLGSDSRTDSFKGRSDSIMVVRVEPKSKRIKMVSFPRDSRVQLPGKGFNKINAAFAYGGPELAVKTVEKFADIRIDGYVVTNFKGFIKTVNQLNGVHINLEKAIRDRQAGPFLAAGPQKMNGLEALALARSRKAVKNGDFGRAANHQKIIKAFVSQQKVNGKRDIVAKSLGLLTNVDTNLSVFQLLNLGFAIINIDDGNIEGVVLEGASKMIGGASSIVLDDRFAKQAFNKF